MIIFIKLNKLKYNYLFIYYIKFVMYDLSIEKYIFNC